MSFNTMHYSDMDTGKHWLSDTCDKHTEEYYKRLVEENKTREHKYSDAELKRIARHMAVERTFG